MNVKNDLQGLQQIMAGQEVSRPESSARMESTAAGAATGADEATLSPAASLAAQTAADSDVRMDRVAGVRQALAAGTYNVPSSAVAGKIIESMLGQ